MQYLLLIFDDQDELAKLDGVERAQIMADYLGLTLETVCRELMALEREMIVASPDPHAIRIQDLEALQNISRAGN